MNSKDFKLIVKNTGILGLVQFMNVLMQALRSKLVVLIIGAEGLGIYSLLTSSAQLFNDFFGFGIQTVATKNISEINYNEGSNFRSLLNTLTFWAFFSGIIGSLLMIVFSNILSKFLFGSDNFKYSIIFVSITVIFNQLTYLFTGILQGLKEIKYLAYSSFVITILNLFSAALCLYILKTDGLILMILIMGLTNVFVLKFYINKTKASFPFQTTLLINFRDLFQKGKVFIKFGFLLSLSGLFASISGYLIRVIISNSGSIDDVGYYSASMSILNSYFGIIFTVMLSEYLPRLVSVKKDKIKSLIQINNQISFVSILLTPILILFSLSITFWISALYSNEFLLIREFLLIAAFGIFFKGISWPISIYLLALGQNKYFFYSETLYNIYQFGLSIIMYKYFGIFGFGISYAISYLIYLIQNYLLIRFKFNLKIKFKLNVLLNFFLITTTIILILQTFFEVNLLIKIILLTISLILSLRELQSNSKIFDSLILRLKQ